MELPRSLPFWLFVLLATPSALVLATSIHARGPSEPAPFIAPEHAATSSPGPHAHAGSLIDPRWDRSASRRAGPSDSKAQVFGTGNADDGRWQSFGGLREGCDGVVSASVGLPDGRVALGGKFTLCGSTPANNVAIFDLVSGQWTALGEGPSNGVDAQVRALAVSEGNLYVGGGFRNAGELHTRSIAKWNGMGWESLTAGDMSGTNGEVYALAVRGNDLFVGGDFSIAGDVQAHNVARWDGSAWHDLGQGPGSVWGSLILSLAATETELFAGGTFLEVGGDHLKEANNIARWDGVSWSALGGEGAVGVNGTVAALAASSEGLYVGGRFTAAGGQPAMHAARWNGSTWSALGAGVDAAVGAILVRDGDVYFGGGFVSAGGEPAKHVARWDGAAWSNLASGGMDGVGGPYPTLVEVHTLASSSDTLFVGGRFDRAGTAEARHVAQWNDDEWSSLGALQTNAPNGKVHALVASGNGVYVGGLYTRAGNVDANSIAHWDGTTWTSLGSGTANGVNGYIYALMMVDDNLYVGGSFTEAGGLEANNIAVWDGSAWSTLGTGMGITPYSMVLAIASHGSDVYAAGEFGWAGGEWASRIARWDGSRWYRLGPLFNDGLGGGAAVALASWNDALYVGGRFGQAGLITANRVARWDGSAWSALTTESSVGVNYFVWSLAIYDDALIVAGDFSHIGDTRYNQIAAWDGDAWTGLGDGVGSGIDDYRRIRALAVSGSDLYAGGSFASVDGVDAIGVARWNGSSWNSLGAGAANGVDGHVHALAVVGDDLYVAGQFVTAGGKVSYQLARWSPRALIFADTFESPDP
jgi:trimeric autotransporter adhesin